MAGRIRGRADSMQLRFRLVLVYLRMTCPLRRGDTTVYRRQMAISKLQIVL